MNFADRLVRETHRIQAATSGIAITYRRGADTCSLTAVPAATLDETQELGSVQEIGRARDWLVSATDLVLAAGQTTPANGDRIEQSDNGAAYVWEAMASNSQTPPWRWADAGRQRLRIHTKLVSMT